MRRFHIPLALLTFGSAAALAFACDGEDGPANGGAGDGGAGEGGDGDGDQGGAAGDGDISLGGPCASDKDCRAANGVCDTSIGACVECSTGADCATGFECISARCQEVISCTSSKNCPTDQVCDTVLSRCVECVGENDCAMGQTCSSNVCATICTSDKDCTSNDQVCNLEGGICVECLTNADCGSGQACGQALTCVTANVSDGTGGNGSSGGCAPKARILLQRSGAMFELPSAEDNWWNAVSDALDNDSTDLLDQFAEDMDLSLSTFHMNAASETCPILNTQSSIAPDGLATFLNGEETDHVEAPEKIDAPLPESITQAAGELGASGDRYLILIVTGLPDSCEEQDGLCAAEPAMKALQEARADGIVTKLLFLDPTSASIASYPQSLANAAAGDGIGEEPAYGECDDGLDSYSDSPGMADFASADEVGDVVPSLTAILGQISSCE